MRKQTIRPFCQIKKICDFFLKKLSTVQIPVYNFSSRMLFGMMDIVLGIAILSYSVAMVPSTKSNNGAMVFLLLLALVGSVVFTTGSYLLKGLFKSSSKK